MLVENNLRQYASARRARPRRRAWRHRPRRQLPRDAAREYARRMRSRVFARRLQFDGAEKRVLRRAVDLSAQLRELRGPPASHSF